MSANTESSAMIQWSSAINDGSKMPITSYLVTNNDDLTSIVVNPSNSTVVVHRVYGLKYNTHYIVKVEAVDICGLQSEPATVTVNILARGQNPYGGMFNYKHIISSLYIHCVVPPIPTVLSVELSCNVPLKAGRPVIIKWEVCIYLVH